ncbi:Dual_specificity phosphatase [Hexamita inflata]|uniref:Dual specificity phosphatase n=1 Tax=Hexamita inflata TaxID=28002 RepID=A0AA86N7W2_9EUKA|nr:Dual specificity phosphatase [Hexamita inflata]
MANRVLDSVFVGGHFAAEDEDFIFTNSISRVINTVGHQIPNRFQQMNVKYLTFQFDQNGSSVIFDPKDERITQVVRFVNEAVEQDSCVLIHSQNGDSRSIVLMAAYLIHRFHWPPHRALQFIATKRSNARPHTNYVKQLHEFANRRRAKYGEFKDIFGNIKSLKLNFQEYLHRNTFLNAVMGQDPVEGIINQNSPIESLFKFGIMQKKNNNVKSITFRDGLQTAQIPSQYATFDQNGNPANPQMYSQLFRPKSPSYNSALQTRCLPVRVDPALLPTVSFDLDIPGCHLRRADGYLQSITPDMSGYAVVARPVSILKNGFGSQYDESSIVIPVKEFEEKLGQIDDFKVQAVSNSVETRVEDQNDNQIKKFQVTQQLNQQASRPTQQRPLVAQQRPLIQQVNISSNQNPPPSQMLGKQFSRVRPPTPPRKTDVVASPVQQTSTQSQMMRPVTQQVYTFNQPQQNLSGSMRPSSASKPQSTGQLSSSFRPTSSKPQTTTLTSNQPSVYQPKWK